MTTFSEPEQFLLRRWKDARLLEDSMKRVGKTYENVLDLILVHAKKKNLELDFSDKYIYTENWSLVIAKNSWPKHKKGYPTGYYIENMLLDNLTSLEQAPYKYVWITGPGIDMKEARGTLLKAAKDILKQEECLDLESRVGSNSEEAWIKCPLGKSRDEFLNLLMTHNAQGFIDCIVAQFDWMAKFTSVVDKIVNTCKLKAEVEQLNNPDKKA